jgi:phage tail-like protein
MAGLPAVPSIPSIPGVPGLRRDPYGAYQFLVEIDGLIVAGFSEVSGLAVETEVLEYREGGVNDHMHRLAGPVRHPGNIVLRRGLTAATDLWSWHQDIAAGKITRRHGAIVLLNGLLPAWRWNFRDAYPARWTGPELRAGGSAVALESLEIAHEGITTDSAEAGLLGALNAVASAFGV